MHSGINLLGSSKIGRFGFGRRRNVEVKRSVVLSPSKDDKGDYLNVTGASTNDEKRLKQILFQSFLENSKKPPPETIFERDYSPSDDIE